MGILELALSLGGLLTLVLSVASYLRQNKIDASDFAAKITKLEHKAESIEMKYGNLGLSEIPELKHKVENLSERVTKLDNDLENKIDKLAEKMDGLVDRLNQVLINLAKQGMDA